MGTRGEKRNELEGQKGEYHFKKGGESEEVQLRGVHELPAERGAGWGALVM